MNFKRLIRKTIASLYIFRAKANPSFAQAGEDVIVQYLFNKLKIKRPTYLDIGANLPVLGNNTYFFYNKGSRGVCVEPDPDLYRKIQRCRPKDTNLNYGIGVNNHASADFFIFPDPHSGWNTFSKEEAEQRERGTGIRIKEIKKSPLKSINEVIAENFETYPNFLSIDVEGLDLAILETIDFEKYKPEIICAETITFSPIRQGEKISEIADFLKTKNYFVFADTHINTIFCRTDAYKLIE
jgi:FkbM family methyltransferase